MFLGYFALGMLVFVALAISYGIIAIHDIPYEIAAISERVKALDKWTVPTAVLGGIVIIGTMLLLMNYKHPYSEVARQSDTTAPIIAEVRGRAVDVPVGAASDGLVAKLALRPGAIALRLRPLMTFVHHTGIDGCISIRMGSARHAVKTSL
jgi:multidrug resistance efflux pump